MSIASIIGMAGLAEAAIIFGAVIFVLSSLATVLGIVGIVLIYRKSLHEVGLLLGLASVGLTCLGFLLFFGINFDDDFSLRQNMEDLAGFMAMHPVAHVLLTGLPMSLGIWSISAAIWKWAHRPISQPQ